MPSNKQIFAALYRCRWAIGIAIVCIAAAFFLWRYSPVRIMPHEVHKVMFPDPTKPPGALCSGFELTPEQFAAYFAQVHRLTKDEEDDYGYGGCYFETNIEGRTFRIWLGGTAEIIDNDESTYYADTARKLNMNP
jgi:hypothetical protein